MPIEQDRSHGDPVKTEYDQDQGFALVGQMRKPLSFAPPLICGWQRNTQRLFLWDRPANGSAKTGRTGTSCRVNSEDQFCRGKVKGMQSLVWVPGRNVRRRSRARPRPVKCWEPTLSTGYYLPTGISFPTLLARQGKSFFEERKEKQIETDKA